MKIKSFDFLFAIIVTLILLLLIQVALWVPTHGDKVCEFDYKNNTYQIYVNHIEYWDDLGEYWESTGIIPKKATDSINYIHYSVYEKKLIMKNKMFSTVVEPWKEDILTSPTQYMVNKIKSDVDQKEYEINRNERFINKLKCD